MSDVYYAPEKFGLEPVAEYDFSDGNYCFDLRVVWYHKNTDTYYTMRDSGCSCPSPFESYTTLESLDKANFDELLNEIKDNDYDYGDALQKESYRNKLVILQSNLKRKKSKMNITITLTKSQFDQAILDYLQEKGYELLDDEHLEITIDPKNMSDHVTIKQFDL